MCAVNPNRSRSGPVSCPDRVVAPTRVNGAMSNGIEVAPGPLPTITSTRKSSIARYSISSAGPGDPVDLVDEQHVALDQIGQDRGQVAGPLQRRAGGQPQRGAQFRGDDHRQRRLAQARRPGEQHVIRRGAAQLGPGQHQLQLLADLLLADELAHRPGAQRRLDVGVAGHLIGGHHRLDDVVVLVGARRGSTVASQQGQRPAQQDADVTVGHRGILVGGDRGDARRRPAWR